jgi:hypothetical protein
MLRIVMTKVHHFAFFDVKIHAPQLRPFTEFVESQLESLSVLRSADSVPQLCVISKLSQHLYELHHCVYSVNVDGEV